MIVTEKDYISQCKKQIEKRFNLNADLIERDFEYLHEVILEQTKTDISTSTLRRIWSDKHQSIPQSKTLDALAQLLGHTGWHTFKLEQKPSNRRSLSPRIRSMVYILGLIVLISSILLLTSTDEVIGEVSLRPEIQVIEGVPVTLGFHYDIQSSNIDIELSWNPYERTRLDKGKDFYTGTYFYPDYHTAKLLHEEQVLTTSSVHVTTDGWHGLIMDAGYDTRPTYLESAEYMLENKLFVSKGRLVEIGEQTGIALPVFTLSHTDLSSLSGDDFTLKATVRSEAYSREQSCLLYEVLIKGANKNIRIPISQDGCYGLTELKCASRTISGKHNDLSALSTDLSQAHPITIRLKSSQMVIDVADNETFVIDYEEEIGPLKVIKFIFQGSAEISEFQLLNDRGVRLKSLALHPF